jgi:hypothetical protein
MHDPIIPERLGYLPLHLEGGLHMNDEKRAGRLLLLFRPILQQ